MYDVLSRFYDAVHADVHEDIDFILTEARAQQGDVLDLGCGTGRITLPLAEAGFHVTGIDNAQAMLDVAAQKVSAAGVCERVDLLAADMVKFDVTNKDYSLAFITQNTVMHLNQVELRGMLKSVRRHLAEGGLLLVDTANPLQLASAPDQPSFQLERRLKQPDGSEVLQYARWKNDREAQCMTVEWRYVADDGEVVHAETKYHYLYPHTLQMLMLDNGLEWRSVYGEYDQSDFRESSERLIILAGCL